MSTIEERLARDIAAFTGGVVVTESDLKDAHDVVEERLEFGRQRSRRRTVATVVAAAVVIPIVGVAVARAVDKDESAPPPAAPVTPVTPVETVHADPAPWLTGHAPTPELVQGVWREDNGGVQIRFSAPDAFTSDNRGRLFHDPGLVGTWELTGDEITINVTGGTSGCAGETFAMRSSLAEEGLLRFAPTRPAPARCSFLSDGWGALEQVLPTSPGLASFKNANTENWAPWPSRRDLYGLWMAEGGGYAMEIGADGTYDVADQSGEPVDRGQWSLRDTELTMTSSVQSVACSTGDRVVWSDVEQLRFGTFALRATVKANTCRAPWAAKHWILIPYEGSDPADRS